ncbi:MAG: hypothetical protein AAB703_02830 [Pseudomonadota bacterium]
MIRREKYTGLKDLLDTFPAAALLGPRQAGENKQSAAFARPD